VKVPVSWLKEYVAFDASPEELAERLTFSGTEVEAIDVVGASYEGVVVGEVKEKRPHPGADDLFVCVVSDGERDHGVVCGAPNFKVGDKAPFAPVGAVLPGGVKVKAAVIRGEKSAGMLCAEDELGISDHHSGLVLLPEGTRTGTPLAEVMGPEETVLTLEVTWNRPDCLSIIGIAREVAALFDSRLRKPSVEFDERGDPVESLGSVVVEDAVGCPRYTARVTSGVKIGPSPMWMQRRLSLSGVRPIANVVDITNYVMIECGQPLHAFDHRLLAEHRIIVRRAEDGETMTTLDEVERDLNPEVLVIADPRGAVAVAGVMGGAGSEIAEDTSVVLLESACFDAASIARTSWELGLATESSHRFERGVDVAGVDWASRRATSLMLSLAGGAAAKGVVDVCGRAAAERKIRCRYSRCRGLLGVDIGGEEIVSILGRLELGAVQEDDDGCTVSAPSFRPDLAIEADLIEEVARLHGLEGVPASVPRCRVVPDADDVRTKALLACRGNLIGLGLSEIMNYSFVSEGLLEGFDAEVRSRRVALPNPVSSEYGILRTRLAPQMVESLGRNLARQVLEARFFEIGKVFLQGEGGEVCEEEHLCIGLMGRALRSGLEGKRLPTPGEMFLWLKGVVEQLCLIQHLDGVQVRVAGHQAFEPGWVVDVLCDDRPCGVLGLVDSGIRGKWRMSEPIGVAEMVVDPLLRGFSGRRELGPSSVYPGVTRDVALIVDEAVSHEEIVGAIRSTAPQELTRIELFDIFRDEGIGAGKKSLAYSLTYRSLERSLTDEEANAYHESIKDSLKSGLEVEIREG